MVDSAPQWEAVLRRQKEKNQVDPNNRRSRHRSRSYVGSPSTFLQNQGACRQLGRAGRGTRSLLTSHLNPEYTFLFVVFPFLHV